MLYSHAIWAKLSAVRANTSLMYCCNPILLNLAGVCSEIKLGAGRIIPSCLGLQNLAIESLSFSKFTIARCSIFRCMPFVIIYHVVKHATKAKSKCHEDVRLHKEKRKIISIRRYILKSKFPLEFKFTYKSYTTI